MACQGTSSLRPFAAVLVLGAALVCTVARAGESTMVEGGSGILSVPTAEVVREGGVVFTMGRLMSRSLQTRGESIARSFSATIGYLPGLEVVAHINDYPLLPDSNHLANFQDRSIAVKYQLYSADDWAVAVGSPDIGGESQTQHTVYATATYNPTEEWSISAGAGSGSLSGVFGGVKYSPAEWLSLLGEYDTQDVNYGVELHPLKGLTLKGGVVNEHSALSASYSFPLDPRNGDSVCRGVAMNRCETRFEQSCDQAAAIRDALQCESFENVLVGVSGDTVYVELENRRFREEVDALGVALAVVAQHAGPEVTQVCISPKVDDIPQITVSSAIEDYIAFLADPESPVCFTVTHYGRGFPADTVWAEEGSKTPGRGDFMLRPYQRLAIGVEYQPAWQAQFGAELEGQAYLAHGVRMVARARWPLMNDITDKTDPIMRDAVLQLHNKVGPQAFATASAGYFGAGSTGMSAQLAWYEGSWLAGARYGYLDKDSASDSEDGAALAELGWRAPELDWELSAIGGQFMDGDQGLRVESRRYFGPTELSFFAYNTNMGSTEGGFRLMLPIPGYDEGRHGSWKAGLAPDFNYTYNSTLDAGGQLPPGQSLERVRERLSPEYVSAHADWMRRAVWLWSGGS